MALYAGTKVAPYEITSLLGERSIVKGYRGARSVSPLNDPNNRRPCDAQVENGARFGSVVRREGRF
jgi:hypothetical protein